MLLFFDKMRQGEGGNAYGFFSAKSSKKAADGFDRAEKEKIVISPRTKTKPCEFFHFFLV